MVEKAKKIPTRLLEFWKKFSSKQKTIIISVVLTIVLAIGLLSMLVSKPQYIALNTYSTTKEASDVVEILKSDETIDFKKSADGLTIKVNKKNRADALLLLAKEGIPKIGMTKDDLLKNGIGTTESERQLKNKLYSQDDLGEMLTKYEGVKEAFVRVGDKEVDNTVLAETKERTASVILNTTENFDKNLAETIANIVAGAIGNDTTDKIKVSNQKGILFAGSNNSIMGSATGTEKIKAEIRTGFENRLASQLQAQGYNDANVMADLSINADKINENKTMYKPEADQKGGYVDTESNYEATGTSASGGVPGTDSNGDDTSYQLESNGSAGSKIKSNKKTYRFSQIVTNTDKEIGTINLEESSVNIVLKNYKVYKEKDLKKQGLLKGTTFDKYAADNSAPKVLPVDQTLIDAVAAATGLKNDVNTISIQAYEEPVFQASESGFKVTNYLMIMLAVLIIALLIFVVFKGTSPVEVTELEPELSVEQLLATTKENQSLDDIEFSDKSETRKMIEKFVDENPEAVAQLLRNWLNEDWG